MRPLILYPFLFILYVVLTPLIPNLDQVDPSQALQPFVFLFVASAIGMLLFYAAFRDWQYAGYLVFLVLAFFFVSGHLFRVLLELFAAHPERTYPLVLVIWGVILGILALRKVWACLGGEHRITPALNFILALALLGQILSAFPDLIRGMQHLAERKDAKFLPITGNPVNLDCSDQPRPDIYYIILDAYGRSDILEAVYGIDNSRFIDFLEQAGFYIANQSHSNYMQTIYSISSSLNFAYINPEPATMSGQEYFTQLISENRIMETLSQCGYQRIAFESGFSFTNHPDVNTYLTHGNKLNEFENLLLSGTPLEGVARDLNLEPPANSYQAHRERVLFDLDQLRRLPERQGPKIVFAHIISPHPPFVFDANGGPVQSDRGYSLGDGNDFRGSWEEYRKGYIGQVQFIDGMLETVIKDILQKSPTPPIIILQGDHGPGGFLDWSSPEQTCLWERTSILNAYYLPGGVVAPLYPSISPVNTFRIILNAYFGAGLELATDKTYFTSQRLPRQVIDVTGERNSRDACGSP